MGATDAPCVETWSGREIDLTRPHADQICIGDIATQLSRIPRFNGATRFPWTVAQHSLLVCHLLGDNTMARRWGLLHDAHESYVGDLVTPLKAMLWPDGMSDWQRIVDRLDDAIAEAFGCHRSIVIAEIVGWADLTARAIEADRLLTSRGQKWLTSSYLPQSSIALPLAGESEEKIREAFLAEFDRLFPGVRRG